MKLYVFWIHHNSVLRNCKMGLLTCESFSRLKNTPYTQHSVMVKEKAKTTELWNCIILLQCLCLADIHRLPGKQPQLIKGLNGPQANTHKPCWYITYNLTRYIDYTQAFLSCIVCFFGKIVHISVIIAMFHVLSSCHTWSDLLAQKPKHSAFLRKEQP